MADSPQTHFLNADFDLGLRPRPGWRARPQIVRVVQELSLQGLLGADAADSTRVRGPVPDEFLDHLSRCGLVVPRVLVEPQLDPGSRLRPFGWSAESIALNHRHEHPVAHPSLAVIERVNSRRLAFEIEADLAPDGVAGKLIASVAELEAFLHAAAPQSEWLLKSEHGNSGLANRRLRKAQLLAADARFVEGLLAEDDRLLVEPWLDRERDWCVVFDVPWNSATVRTHEVFCTRDGGLVGALFEPEGPRDTPHTEPLTLLAERVAGKLEAEGYFGPACFDAFIWRSAEAVQLRALADLNCRFSMSDGAHRLWRRLAPQQAYYYRFFNRRKLTLPASLAEAMLALEDRALDRTRGSGILFVSPLDVGKLAVVMIAPNRDDIFALESWFRARFEH